jgi:putative tricarboxylic transport membrane protein
MPLQLARTDELTSVLLVAFAVSVFLVSDSFPSGVGGTPGPALYPRFIAGGIAVLAVIQFIDAVVLRESTEQTVARGDLIRFGIPVALLLGYALVLPLAGFLFTTVGFLVAVMYYSGARDLRMTVPLAFAISVVLQNVFVGFLHVPLPGGPLDLGRAVSLTVTGGIL